MKELPDPLTAMGIEPLGALEKVPSLVDYCVCQPPINTADDLLTTDVLEQAIAEAGPVAAQGAAVDMSDIIKGVQPRVG